MLLVFTGGLSLLLNSRCQEIGFDIILLFLIINFFGVGPSSRGLVRTPHQLGNLILKEREIKVTKNIQF